MLCSESTIAVGVVVSRMSSGFASFSDGSLRSRRVTGSPIARSHAVSPAGPPCAASSRFAAVLSLTSTIAAQSRSTDNLPRARWARTTGAWSSRSARSKAMSSQAQPPGLDFREDGGGSGSLKVEHIA